MQFITRIKIAQNNVATNVMIANNERNIIYMNKSVLAMMSNAESDIRKELPNFNVSKLIGFNIDGFHKNPAHQKNMLATFTSTHRTQIVVGGHGQSCGEWSQDRQPVRRNLPPARPLQVPPMKPSSRSFNRRSSWVH